MNAIEEGGRAARTFMEAMKEQPLALALVVMNLCLLGFLYYGAVVATNERHLEMMLLYQNRSEMAQLLYQCVPNPGGK